MRKIKIIFLLMFPLPLFAQDEMSLTVLPFTGVSKTVGSALASVFAAELSKIPNLSVSVSEPSSQARFILSGEASVLGGSNWVLIRLLDQKNGAVFVGTRKAYNRPEEIPAFAPVLLSEIFGKAAAPAPKETSYAARIGALLTNAQSVDAQDSRGYSLLSLALIAGYDDIAEALLEEDADPNLPASNGITPLMLAAGRFGSDRIVEALLSKGAGANIFNKEGQSPLFLAVNWGRIGAARLLLRAGANPNLKNSVTPSPLMEAARQGRRDFTLLLLEHKADPNIQEEDGISALMEAVRLNNEGLVRLLLEKGADPALKAQDGTTAEDRARNLGLKKIAQILTSAAAPKAPPITDPLEPSSDYPDAI